jgi:hypothetical protein
VSDNEEWAAALRHARAVVAEGRLGTLSPAGWGHHDAAAVARVLTLCPAPGAPRSTTPTAEEALAALALLQSVREWAEAAEPRLVDAARSAGVTWERLAPAVGVGDRRAAQMRRRRQGPPHLDRHAADTAARTGPQT